MKNNLLKAGRRFRCSLIASAKAATDFAKALEEAGYKDDFVFPDDLDFCQCETAEEIIGHKGISLCSECVKPIKSK